MEILLQQGMVMRGNQTLVIESLKRHKREVFDEESEERVPVIISAVSTQDQDPKCGLKPGNKRRLRAPSQVIVDLSEKVRAKRQARPVHSKAIELAVFVDDELYDKTNEDYGSESVDRIEEFVFAYLNAVQLLYQSEKLKTKLKIVLVRLEVLTSPSWDMNKHGGKIEAYLDSFCAWQKLMNPGINQLLPDKDNPDHWDHGLMLTGKSFRYTQTF